MSVDELKAVRGHVADLVLGGAMARLILEGRLGLDPRGDDPGDWYMVPLEEGALEEPPDVPFDVVSEAAA